MKLLRSLYALTIFLSAFLLFVVEPMVAKQLLPTLGGSSAVWTTCLVFFSIVLLLGYLYAHWVSSRFTPIQQAVIHILLLTAALLMLGVHISPKPVGGQLSSGPDRLPGAGHGDRFALPCALGHHSVAECLVCPQLRRPDHPIGSLLFRTLLPYWPWPAIRCSSSPA